MEITEEILSNKYCCAVCNKQYTRKSSLETTYKFYVILK